MSSSETINSKRLFVGNLSFGTNWRTLKDHFKSVGNATFASIITDPATKRSRGCGIVEMETVEQAKEAIKTLNETELEGRKIFVREDQRSKEKQQPNNEVKQVEVKKDQPATTAQAPKDVKVPKEPKQPKEPKVPKEPKEPKQPKEKKPKQTEAKDVKAENGESAEAKQPKQPKEKKPKQPKQPKAEGSAESSSDAKVDQPKTVVAPKVEQAKTETSAPATTTEGTQEPKEKKPKKKRSKKPKTEGTETKTAESSEVKATASGEASEKKEDDDGFREVRKRERRGRGALATRGSRGGRGAARGGVARRPRTEGGSASNSPSTEEKPERKPKTPDTSKSSGKSIFVSNLPKTTSGEDVAKLFDAAGKVVKAELKVDAKGQPRGLAQVLFETPEAATKAIETVNGTELEGRKLNVRLDYFA